LHLEPGEGSVLVAHRRGNGRPAGLEVVVEVRVGDPGAFLEAPALVVLVVALELLSEGQLAVESPAHRSPALPGKGLLDEALPGPAVGRKLLADFKVGPEVLVEGMRPLVGRPGEVTLPDAQHDLA